jgi:hypothetical protein
MVGSDKARAREPFARPRSPEPGIGGLCDFLVGAGPNSRDRSSEEACCSSLRAKSQCTDGVYETAQGLMVIAPIPSKSFVLRVTIVKSLASAVAPINESIVGKVRPVRVP